MGFEESGVHAVDAEHDHPFAGGLGGGVGASGEEGRAKEQGEKQKRPTQRQR